MSESDVVFFVIMIMCSIQLVPEAKGDEILSSVSLHLLPPKGGV